MRNITEDELSLFYKDIKAFEQYCSIKGLMTDKFKERYDGLKIQIGEVEGVEGAGGKSDRKNKTVILRSDKLKSEKTRRHVLYHEIGHFLFGFGYFSNSEQNEVLKRIVRTQTDNKQLLNLDALQYISGIRLLEEYIVEKFAVNASHETLKENVQIDYNIGFPFSVNYSFDTTFPGAYGVFETLCDKLLEKAYENFEDILSSCLNSNFYKELFEKYDEVGLMQILGEFGYVRDSIILWAKNRTIRSETQETLENLEQMISKINVKNVNRANSNGVTPTSIAQKSIQCMQENPGVVSEGVRKLRGVFSRNFNKNKKSQKR